MGDRYEKLEGKIVRVVNTTSGEVAGLVAGCDKDIGITVVAADNHDQYLVCLVCNVSSEYNKNLSVRFFDVLLAMIENGFVDNEALPRICRGFCPPINRNGHVPNILPSAENCPFGQ